MMKRFAFAFLLLLLSSFSFGQFTLRGKVVDSKTGEPLPFVNIVYNERGQGITTELNGTFYLSSSYPIKSIKLSYVGYSPKQVSLTNNDNDRQITIGLNPLAYQIDEVVVKPGINPAHRIIHNVFANSKTNNPERLKHFRYNSYNKMYFTFETDSLDAISKTDSIPTTKADSLNKKIIAFKNKQHIFMMESVTERNFKYPNSNSETVLASRVSGLKDPFFVFLATQFQSFSFYNELVNLGGKNYLNPISKGSTSRYLFILKDTLFTQSFDTLFVISFRPLIKHNFSALKGVLNINSNGYAIQSVIAEPVEQPSPLFTLKIQQRYEMVDSSKWFPVELNTNLYLNMVNAQAKDTATGQVLPISIAGIGNSYIKNIDLNPQQRNRDFNHIELTFDPLAGEKDEDFWLQFRNDSLTPQEQKTYEVIDSLGEGINLDRQMRIAETLITGKIPVKFLNVDLNKLLSYNQFEGYRLGLGLETNQRMLKWLTIGGYYAYGFTDKEHKYGGFAQATLSQRHQVSISASYQHDVREPGELKFPKPFGLINTDQFRNFLIWKMDYVDKYSAGFNFRLLKNFSVSLSASQLQFTATSGFNINLPNGTPSNTFNTNEFGADIRFVWKETFMETPRGLLPLGYGFPLIWASYQKGITDFGGSFNYSRLSTRIDYQINHRTIGKTSITFNAGLLSGDVPTPLLQFGPGNNGKYPIDATASFGAMDLYEFVSDRYAYAFLRHNFGTLFWKTKSKYFKPQFALVQNFAIGSYKQNSLHNFEHEQPKTLSKGYHESGLLINGILSNPFYSLGVGAYYRWGDYSSEIWQENIAIKLTLSTNL